ncbi:MAG TPA: hypothetical protein VFX51_10570, partial [Solirubrobacteraceae bacterium]|nr:hypothetical protein [Solirubrobacteraceae bacterium]
PWIVRPLEMMRAGRFYLPAPGDGLITPIFVDDLVDAIVRALREPQAAGRAYTIWDGHAVTAREFFGHHARSLGQGEVRVLPAALLRVLAGAFGAGPAAVTFVSRRATYPNTRAREELGWTPRFSLDEGMARTL